MHCRKEFRTEQERPYWRGDITSDVTINRGYPVFVLGHWKINVFVFVFGKVCLTPSLLPPSTHIPALVVSESLQPLQCFPVRPGNVKLKPNGYIKGKGMSLYSTISNPLDRSKRFTLHPPVNAVHSDANSILWEAFSHTAITAQRLFTRTLLPLSTVRRSFIQLSELGRRGENEMAAALKQLTFHSHHSINCKSESIIALSGRKHTTKDTYGIILDNNYMHSYAKLFRVHAFASNVF